MLTKEKINIALANDLLFKETLTSFDNREALIDLIVNFTNYKKEELKNLTIFYESILTKTKINDKSLRGDILIEFGNNKINLESYSYFDKNSFNKSLTYIMRIASTSLDRGRKNYRNMDKVLGINFALKVEKELKKDLILGKNMYRFSNVHNLKQTAMCENLIYDIYPLDLDIDSLYNLSERQRKWLKFLKAKNYEERKIVAKGDKILMNYNERIEEYINDEKTRRIFGEWAEYIAIQKAAKEKYKEGKKEGISEGKSIGVNNMAKAMLADGVDITTIQKYSKLSKAEIEKLSL